MAINDNRLRRRLVRQTLPQMPLSLAIHNTTTACSCTTTLSVCRCCPLWRLFTWCVRCATAFPALHLSLSLSSPAGHSNRSMFFTICCAPRCWLLLKLVASVGLPQTKLTIGYIWQIGTASGGGPGHRSVPLWLQPQTFQLAVPHTAPCLSLSQSVLFFSFFLSFLLSFLLSTGSVARSSKGANKSFTDSSMTRLRFLSWYYLTTMPLTRHTPQ